MDWRDILYPVYSKDQIEEYAFTLCIRSDGSLYGTADGNKCRIGTETSRSDVMDSDMLNYLSPKSKAKAAASLEALNDEQFARITTQASQIVKDEVTPNIRTMRPDQIEDIKPNADKLLKMYDNPEAYFAKLKKVDEKEVDAMMDLLTPEVLNRNSLVVKQVAKNDGMTVQEVKRAMIKRFMEQDGKDLYTGKPLSLLNAELEHVKPFTVIGEAKANKMNNLGWIGREINASKSNSTMQDFLDKKVLNKTSAQAKKEYDAAVQRKTGTAALKASAEKDAKLLKGQASKIIEKYGKNVTMITAKIGFPTTYKDPAKKDRNVSAPLYKNVKRGSKTVNPQHFILINYGNWSSSQQKKAQSIVRDIWADMRDGKISKDKGNEKMLDLLEAI